MASVSNFGTGQYSLTLPFLVETSVRHSFNGVIDVLGDGTVLYQIFGITDEGQAIAYLSYTSTNGITVSLTGAAPVTLTVNSRIYLNGAYVAQES